MGANKIVAGALIACCLCSQDAKAGNCDSMVELATFAAKLREAGVPLADVEARLRRDVKVPEELGMSIVVVRLIYKTRGTSDEIRAVILKTCK